MRRMTLFVSPSSQVMLSMHDIIWFSVTLLCEGCLCACVCACVQPVLAQCTPGCQEPQAGMKREGKYQPSLQKLSAY